MMFSPIKTAPLTRFLDNKGDIERVRQCFAGLWSWENDSIMMSAIESPELFALKPQREGGGIYVILSTMCRSQSFHIGQ
jgi:hypothetical protein